MMTYKSQMLADLRLTDADRGNLRSLASSTGKSEEQIIADAYFLLARCYNTLKNGTRKPASKSAQVAVS